MNSSFGYRRANLGLSHGPRVSPKTSTMEGNEFEGDVLAVSEPRLERSRCYPRQSHPRDPVSCWRTLRAALDTCQDIDRYSRVLRSV